MRLAATTRKAIAGLSAFALLAWPGAPVASTMVEVPAYCKYVNVAGKIVFAGRCTINWGTGPAEACANPKNLVVRDILEFSSHSEAEVDFFCNDVTTVNGHRAFAVKGTSDGSPVIRVLTEGGEYFEFSLVGENSPGPH